MNEYLSKFRAQYPEYGDMSDAELAKALHAKFYADMSYPEFASQIGLSSQASAEDEAMKRVAASGGPVRDFMHMAAEGATFGQADRLAGLLPGGQSRQQFQQRTDDLQMLAPGASRAAGAAGALAPAGALLRPVVNTVRVARAQPGVSAMTRIGALARNPLFRGALGGSVLSEMARRALDGK